MTIDEAIAHEIKIVEDNKIYNFENIVHYHEQLTEWLEELKAYRTLDKTNFSDGYNKAIDDVCKTIEEECGYDEDINDDCYFEISRTTLLYLAEQLKAGGKNGI